MYVEDGLSLERIADDLGVNRSTLGRWAADDGWDDARRQYRQDSRSIRAGTLAARKKLAQAIAQNPDPQLIYAFCRLEAVAMRDREFEIKHPEAKDERKNMLKKMTKEDLVAMIEERIYGL